MIADEEDNINNNNNIFDELDDEDWILEKPISVFALDPADRRVLKVADQRDAVQKKTFTKWINFHLSKRHGLHVDDLFLDLRDGHVLISLLEIFTNQTLPREKGTSKFHALQNIEQCLQCLEQDHNIRLVNIRPEELANGNPKLTLGLIWRIILHFQFSDIALPVAEENIPEPVKHRVAPIPTTEPASSPLVKPVRVTSIASTAQRRSSVDQISSNYRNMLLIWARQQCQGYPGIYIENFTHSWRNGRAFLAILHRHNPQLINIKNAYRNSNRENLTHAFDFAQRHYGIMQLIDPEDVDTDEPDEKSILLYIAHLYKVCSTLPTHPFQQQHDRVHLESELAYEYTNLASELLQWIKAKLDFLNSEIKFKSLSEIETYKGVLQAIRYDEMSQFKKVLHRMRSIDAESETLQLNETLQPDIESINIAWNKLETTIDRVENDLKQFIQQYQKLQTDFDTDLDLIERDIASIERLVQMKSRQLDLVAAMNQLHDIQIKIDHILNNCRTLPLPFEQVQSALERIDQLNLRVDNLHILLSPSPPPMAKVSSPTTARTHESSSVAASNGFHHASKRQARSTQQPSSFFAHSPTGIEQLDVIVTSDYRRSGESQQQQQQQQARPTTMVTNTNYSHNETNPHVLVEELRSIAKNLTRLSQALRQRTSRLLQSSLPATNDELLSLCQEHKDYENDLLSQASRIKDIRNVVRQEYGSSSHQELRSLVNQTSDHTQDLFTTSKNYSEKLDIVDTALSLVTDLTSHIIELETRLASYPPLFDDEAHIHRQLADLNELANRSQSLEKSIKELLTQSQQLGNEKLGRTTEQLISRWKQINTEINQRKRSINQCLETHRSFQSVYDQEERVLDNLQRRVEALEPVPSDVNKLRQTGKTVTDLFNEILVRAQSIEHMNDVAVKFIEEAKMHDKNLKNFRVSLRDLHPSLDASVSITRRQQYPSKTQRASRTILQKIEVFDRRYADLLAKMEQYARLFVKNCHAAGQNITLPLDSASSIVHLYRSTIASRYNITLQSLLSSDDDAEQSTKINRSNQNNSKTSLNDLSRGKVTVEHHHHHHQQPTSPVEVPVSLETTYVIPSSEHDSSASKKVRFIVQKESPPSATVDNFFISSAKADNMSQRKTLSFVDAVNNKQLDLSTGLFSSPLPFALSSSSFSSTTLSSDQHRHPHTHFSSSSSTPHATISTTDNKNLPTTSSSSLTVNNHHSPIGVDSNTSATTISLKEAIDANILDAHSAYVVDTLEQRNYDLSTAYARGLITANNHRVVDRTKDKQLTLADALKMGILKVGDSQSYNIISKTESLVISSVYDHRANTFIDPNSAIRKRILDPYHGLYLNNVTQESISIDDAMNKNLIIVQQQASTNQPQNDKYVISTSLIRETRSYHLLGVRDYVNDKELSVQEAIRLGILDKQNGQYINRKTNQIFSISEAIAQGHIRAQPLPVESASSSTTTNTREAVSTSNGKRGTVKETKTYTLKSAIHPRTNKEIPIRQAIDEGIIDHAKGFYVNSITGENLPISVAIEKGLIFTELIEQPHSRRSAKTLIIEQVIDPITNRRLGVTEAIHSGLLNSTVTAYHHTVKQRNMTILEAYEQGLIIGRFVDQRPTSFIGSQQQQTFYSITSVTDLRTDRVYNLQEGIDQKLLDQRKGVYIHPITHDEISIGDAIKRGIVQVQAVSTQVAEQTSSSSAHSNISVRIDSQPQTSRPAARALKRETEIIEIESIPMASRPRRHRRTTTEEEIVEQTTNVVDKEVIITRARSTERPRQRETREVVIDDRSRYVQPAPVDIKEERKYIHEEIHIESERPRPPPVRREEVITNGSHREQQVHVITSRPQPPVPPRPSPKQEVTRTEIDTRTEITTQRPTDDQQQQQSWSEDEWEQWHCTMMIKDKPYRVVWVMNTATGDRLPLQNAYQRGLVDTKQRLFFDEKLNRQAYSFEKAVELGYMGVEPDTASLPINVDGIDYMIHWVLDSSTKRRIFPRQAVAKQILDAKHGRYINPYNQSQVSLHEAIHMKFIGATEYGSSGDSITVTINGQTYNIKWVYDTRNMKKILPRDALRQGILDIQLNEYRKFDTKDVMTIYDAIQAGYIRCNDDESSSDNSVRPPSIISVDEDELTIATKTATYVITSVIHPLTQKEIKVSEAIDLGILDKETVRKLNMEISSYRDLVTNAQYELAEAINEGLVYATIIETKEDTEMMTSSLQEIIKKFIVKSVALDSDSQEKIGGLEAQAVGILNYAQGVYHDRKSGLKIPLEKAIEKKLLDVELVSQKKFEEYDLELITDTMTEKRITLYKIHGVQNNALGRMESGAVAIKNQMIDTEAKTYTDLSSGEVMSIQEAVNRNLIQAEISEHVERKPLGLSMQNAIRLGFYVAETGTFRDPATEHYMTLMEAIERGHIHVNGVAFADSEQGPITLYDAFSLGLINRRDGGKLNQAKMSLYRAQLVESKLHRMNVEDAIRCGLLNLRTGSYKHPHSGEQLNLKEAIQRGLIDGQSTVIENPSTGRFMTLKEALDGIRIDNEGQVIDSYSNKVITTLELAYNHRKLFSQFDVNAGEVFLPAQNESVGFEKAVRKNLLDNNRIKLFDPKTSREYSIQDAIERGLIDPESGLIYDSHSRATYSIREAIRHGIIAVVGAPLVPIKADHETVAAKITSRNRRRHSVAKSSLHFDYNSAPDSADEDSHGSGGWHRITAKNHAEIPTSANGKRSIRRRTGSSPSRNNNRFGCRDDEWKSGWKGGNNDDDDEDNDRFGGGSRKIGGNSYFSSTTTTSNVRTQDNNDPSNRYQSGRSSSGFQQKQQNLSTLPTVTAKESSVPSNVNKPNGTSRELLGHRSEMSYYVPPATQVSHEPMSSSSKIGSTSDEDEDFLLSSIPTESLSISKVERKRDDEFDQSTLSESKLERKHEDDTDHTLRIEDDEHTSRPQSKSESRASESVGYSFKFKDRDQSHVSESKSEVKRDDNVDGQSSLPKSTLDRSQSENVGYSFKRPADDQTSPSQVQLETKREDIVDPRLKTEDHPQSSLPKSTVERKRDDNLDPSIEVEPQSQSTSFESKVESKRDDGVPSSSKIEDLGQSNLPESTLKGRQEEDGVSSSIAVEAKDRVNPPQPKLEMKRDDDEDRQSKMEDRGQASVPKSTVETNQVEDVKHSTRIEGHGQSSPSQSQLGSKRDDDDNAIHHPFKTVDRAQPSPRQFELEKGQDTNVTSSSQVEALDRASASKSESKPKHDDDGTYSATTEDRAQPSVSESKLERRQDENIEDHSRSSQNDDGRVIHDMHNVASRLTSLHDQLNHYVYLSENLDELRANVKQIKTLHSDVEKEKATIDDLVNRANQINPQLATLSQDLEEKRVEISEINNGLGDIIDRFVTEVDQFNTEHARLTEWIDMNDKEMQKSLELSTLEADNKKFKTILNTGINLQSDVASLQDQLHSIDSTLQDFEQATGNTDGGKSANIYKQLQTRSDTLASNYSDFLKRSKQTSDQCERYLITYDEVNHLNEQVLKSMNEFNQNLASNGNKPQDDSTLQGLLLNVQQQLDKLGMLATHEPASPSPVMSSSYHIQNQIKEHLCTLLDSHTQQYDQAQQGLMHNFELIERYNHERQTIKERIEELNHWLVSYTETAASTDEIFSKPLSLRRSKLDEQIIQFRQFHAQLRTRRHSFDSDINTTINLEQLLDDEDKQNLKSLDRHLHALEEQANQYNDRINRFSTRLNEFHLEHVHLIENYSKRLRLYSEHIEQNDDINFSALQLLLNNDNETPIDHQFYEQLIRDLLATDNIDDKDEILQYQRQVNEHRDQYERFQKDLKVILANRQEILNEYEAKKNFVQDWLLTTDRFLKQYPNELTIVSCEQLLEEHSQMPIEQLKVLNQQLIHFYSSSNLINLYEQLKLTKHMNKHSTITKIFQRQTEELVESYVSMKERLLQHMEILNAIQQQTDKYQLAKQKAESTIEKAKELVTLEENTILPLDHQQIEAMLQKYKGIADQFKVMSASVDEYKTIGLTLINTAERYVDTEPIQNEVAAIDKSWGEYVEYILDTLDYIQLHQEDLREFQQLSNDLTTSLHEQQQRFETLDENELKGFNKDLEKVYEQIESLNQKGELLLQSSATNLNEDTDNQIERSLETINRHYDSLTVKTKTNLENLDQPSQPSKPSAPITITTATPSPPSTTTTAAATTTGATAPQEQETISPAITNQLADELRHHIEETDVAMNELSELLVSATTDTVSAQPIKLSEQLLDNVAVQSELERRKLVLDQLNSNVQTLKQMMSDSHDTDAVKALDQKLTLLNEHWSIMKQANDIRTENLLLTQACATTFWTQHADLATFLDNVEKQLLQIRPRSTSREHIEREKQKYNQLADEFSGQQTKFHEILVQQSSQLLTLIANNPEESEEVQRNLDELEQEWHRIQSNFQTCEQELQQAMLESAEFNSKLERVSTWFDDTSIPTLDSDKDEFERIRTFKEHLDCKYLDIVNLKQDYTDIEQHKQQRIDGTIQQDEHDMDENEKTNLVEEQLVNIDSKWTELNGKIQEHKTLVYETALRQNRVGDVIADINRSLDDCSSKLSVLTSGGISTNLNDMKQIEISIAKLRILLNDIELVSYDIEQLKQSSTDDPSAVSAINKRWEELLKQATEEYNHLENELEHMKLKQKAIDHIFHELDLIDKQVNESTINTKFPLLVERLEHIEEEIDREFSTELDNEQITELKRRLIDVKQRTLTKGQELIELAHSIELFHSSLQKFTEWLTETERYLNNQKPVQRRFGLIQTLLKQIDDHKQLQIQLQTYKEHLIDLDKLATHLKFVSPKNDSIYIRNSMIAAQTRWQKVLARTTERTKELQKAFQDAKKTVRPDVTDIDRIKSEVNRQASLCTCSKKYDVQQVAEGRYRFGESQSLRLVRILRSTVMVRVGGGWTALDEFLVRHDPCRGMHVYSRFLATVTAAKGRTNYELHPESYALRDGVAQTMTLFKPRLVTVHRPTCLFHQQQLAAAAAAGASKQSPVLTPIRGPKDKSRRTSSINSFIQQQQQTSSSSVGDLSASGDDLSASPHILSDSETRPSHIPVPIASFAPSTSTLSRTSSRESVLSEHSIASTSSTQQRRPSKLPLPVSRHKKATNGATPAKNS